jgi:hypothetical protein
VPELLESVTSQELAELRAYEIVNGPIGSTQYADEALASIHELLQQIARLLMAQNAEDEDDIPPLVPYPRPADIFTLQEDDDDGS